MIKKIKEFYTTEESRGKVENWMRRDPILPRSFARGRKTLWNLVNLFGGGISNLRLKLQSFWKFQLLEG